jgi:hypothetical protein
MRGPAQAACYCPITSRSGVRRLSSHDRRVEIFQHTDGADAFTSQTFAGVGRFLHTASNAWRAQDVQSDRRARHFRVAAKNGLRDRFEVVMTIDTKAVFAFILRRRDDDQLAGR